ncbi:fimbrillin family protein [Alistipes sp.]|uniref:fimbrillin family protein n=1 Tax=Alistipes sp. TaxID=1872444 RepID=UPI003A892973
MKRTGKIKSRGRGALPAACALLAAALSLTGCGKEPAENPVGADTEIAVCASLPAVLTAEVSTKAPVDGSAQLTLFFGRSDESGAGTWGSYGASAFTASRTAGTGSRTLTFSSKQYYQANGRKTRMAGWYPSAKSYLNGVVSWTIDGSQDILLATAQEGSKTAAMPAFSFSHALTQLRFFCHAETQTAADQWGKVSAIRVLGQRKTCTYNLASGVFAFSGSSASMPVAGVTAKIPPVGGTASQYGQEMMIEPRTASYQLMLEIETEKKGTQTALLAGRSYLAGQRAEVYILMAEHSISTDIRDAVIESWEEDGTIADTVYPFVLNGNTIVVSNEYGQADYNTYPTHKIWTTTPVHREPTANTNDSGYNLVGEKLQVARVDAVDEEGNPAMTWYRAMGIMNDPSNPTGYSACGEYSEASDQSDKGSWRLPTNLEVRLIGQFIRKLTSIEQLTGTDYWTAAEQGKSFAWRASGNFYVNKASSYYARCVRDLQ